MNNILWFIGLVTCIICVTSAVVLSVSLIIKWMMQEYRSYLDLKEFWDFRDSRKKNK